MGIVIILTGLVLLVIGLYEALWNVDNMIDDIVRQVEEDLSGGFKYE